MLRLLIQAVGPWLVRLQSMQRSRTGRSNPRVRHVRGAFGYAMRAWTVLIGPTRTRSGEQVFPAAVQVQTVNRCNASCPMCPYPQTTGLQPFQSMPDDLWEKLTNELAAEPGFVNLVPMSKNEPLMDKRLEERIALFKAKALPHQQVELVTNGSLLTPERYDRLAAAGVDLLSVSVNAVTPEAYAATMGGLDWERLQQNLSAISRKPAPMVNRWVRLIRQRDNFRQVAEFKHRWKRAGWNVLVYELNNRSGTVAEYEGLREPPSWRTGLRAWYRRLLGQAIFPICPYAFSVAHVLQNGDVPFCLNDWANREVLGNIREQSLRAIWNSPRAQALRELMRQGRYDEIAPCKDCSLWREGNWLG